MVAIAIIIGCILGAIIGINAPTISYTFSRPPTINLFNGNSVAILK